MNAQQRRRREYLMETGREEQAVAEGLKRPIGRPKQWKPGERQAIVDRDLVAAALQVSHKPNFGMDEVERHRRAEALDLAEAYRISKIIRR